MALSSLFSVVSTLSPALVSKFSVLPPSEKVSCSPASIIACVKGIVPCTDERVAASVICTPYPPTGEDLVFSFALTNSKWSPWVTPFAPMLPSRIALLP